jgi:diguanylate cyclase (GGDEF)-like protein
MSEQDSEKQLKRKILEFSTISEVIKELNMSLELNTDKIVDVFNTSVLGLFIMKRAILFLTGEDKIYYMVGGDDGLKSRMDVIKLGFVDKIYNEISKTKGPLKLDQIKDESCRRALADFEIDWIIPMVLRKEIKGIYLIGHRMDQTAYSSDDITFLFAFANQVIVAIENSRYFSLLQRHVEELIVFNELTTAINAGLDTNVLFDMVLGEVQKLLGVEAAFIIVQGQNKETIFFVHRGLDDKKQKIVLENREDGLIGTVLNAASEKIYFFYPKDATSWEKEMFVNDTGENCYWAYRPLFVRQANIVGIVGLAKKTGQEFSNENINLLLTLTNQLIMVILNARLYELAITDGLTGLFLHRYFEQRLREEISRAKRYVYNSSLIMMDIDKFKEYNDTLGHEFGNIVIRSVADHIRTSIRKNEDIACRWGGDEFAVILPETRKEDACIMAERIRRSINEYTFVHGDKKINVSISIGVAAYPDDGNDEKTVIEASDKAMYQSKASGGNKVCPQ